MMKQRRWWKAAFSDFQIISIHLKAHGSTVQAITVATAKPDILYFTLKADPIFMTKCPWKYGKALRMLHHTAVITTGTSRVSTSCI